MHTPVAVKPMLQQAAWYKWDFYLSKLIEMVWQTLEYHKLKPKNGLEVELWRMSFDRVSPWRMGILSVIIGT